MARRLFGRRVVVQVAGLTISAPKIEVDVKMETSPTPTAGWVVVHNLSSDREREIAERGERIVVQAGYGDRIGLLFDGSVQRIERDRENLARRTRIHLSGQVASQKRLGGLIFKTFEGRHTLRSVVEAVIQSMNESEEDVQLAPGPLDLLPEDAHVEDRVVEGSAANVLDELLIDYGITWWEDDGEIRFAKAKASQPDAVRIDLTSANGLIGSPSTTEEGARARSLMNPRLRIGNEVRLRSEGYDGDWRIVSVRHHGSNWDGAAFYSEIELRSLVEEEGPEIDLSDRSFLRGLE